MMGHMPERDIARAGSYVAARRGDLGMSQEDLAKAANVDVKTVRDFELGKRWPWSKTRSAIARALQVSTLDLLAAGETGPAISREDRLTPLDEFERRVLGASLTDSEKLAAIGRHRDQAREQLAELGLTADQPVPGIIHRAVRAYLSETADDGEQEQREA